MKFPSLWSVGYTATHGIIFGLSAALTAIIVSFVYAATTYYTDLPTVSSGSGLTSASWNNLVNYANKAVKQDTEVLTVTGGNVGVGVIPTNGNGVLQVKDGIAFPTVHIPISNPNTLDDYQEGTWTPVLGGYATQGSFVPLASTGFYIKIGRQVTVWIYARGTVSGASADYLTVNGLPFTNSNDSGRSESGGSISWMTGLDMGANGRGWFMYPLINSTRALIGAFTQNGTTTVNPNGTTIALFGTITYYTAN